MIIAANVGNIAAVCTLLIEGYGIHWFRDQTDIEIRNTTTSPREETSDQVSSTQSMDIVISPVNDPVDLPTINLQIPEMITTPLIESGYDETKEPESPDSTVSSSPEES
jgi:hypothetical protein